MEAHHMMNFHHMMELHHVMGFHHCVIRQINFSCALHYAWKVMTRNQINDTFLFQNRVKVKVVGEVSEK